MTPTLSCLTLAIAAALAFSTAHAAAAGPAQTHDKRPVRRLQAVTVSGVNIRQAPNQLSLSTGSSSFTFTPKVLLQLPQGASTPINQLLLQAPGVAQDANGGIHVRGDHGDLQYRINGVILPESLGGFGQTLDTRLIAHLRLLTGALPAQYGLRTAGVVDITTRNGADLRDGGSLSYTGGSDGTLNPALSLFGHRGPWSWFVTASYLQNDLGLANPTAAKRAIHDRTWQSKSFGELSYAINDDTRLSVFAGTADNRFQIPDNPGQVPAFQLAGVSAFDSSRLNERQNERTRFGVLALDGRLGVTRYQVSLGERYGRIGYVPDPAGDLIFNGVASTVTRASHALSLQADFSTPLGERHTLRYGLYAVRERSASDNQVAVFPADASGAQTGSVPFTLIDDHRQLARTLSAYVQDEWSVTDNLTVNYGARADRYQAALSESQLSPRLGLVYQLDENTTLHAGYARYFTPPPSELVSPTDVALFAGTTNAVPTPISTPVQSERTDYLDAGVQTTLASAWTVGLDVYLRRARNLLDEGQFGQALILAPFNYRQGRVHGAELTLDYAQGPLSAYFNLAANTAKGRGIGSGQYNFSAVELAYIAQNYVFLDHAQRLTSSGGFSYALAGRAHVSADYLFGTGLRAGFANTLSLPSYFQLNLSVDRDFSVPQIGKLNVRLAMINALDRVYQLRDGSGIGVGAPQFGPRRGYYLTLQKDF